MSVKYCVDVHVVREADAAALNPTRIIELFKETKRADAAHWPEIDYDYSTGVLMKKILQVKAHETGHLFNYPDEYYLEGGFVHRQYVKGDKTLDFSLGSLNANGNKTWKIESQPNLMGYGALDTSATVSPYYLEYIRQWFSEYTNKDWRIGYAS